MSRAEKIVRIRELMKEIDEHEIKILKEELE